MTPEQAQSIYYDALGAEYQKRAQWESPLVQQEAQLEAWRVVIGRIEGALTLDLMDTGAFSSEKGKH